MENIIVDSATGNVWELLGDKIKSAELEDSSGLRRMLAAWLAKKEYQKLSETLKISAQESADLRAMFVHQFGEPSP